ncbi:MAG: hypothetical protein ABIE23_06425 [archaeon]
MIGPIPVIGFASSKTMQYLLIGIIVIGIILWLVFNFLMKK